MVPTASSVASTVPVRTVAVRYTGEEPRVDCHAISAAATNTRAMPIRNGENHPVPVGAAGPSSSGGPSVASVTAPPIGGERSPTRRECSSGTAGTTRSGGARTATPESGEPGGAPVGSGRGDDDRLGGDRAGGAGRADGVGALPYREVSGRCRRPLGERRRGG